ncbi:MAG: AAA family ATPase [Planctomycetaceae bacterium]|nr:AAA family ATPase [Planctomycetaceae bacterium]
MKMKSVYIRFYKSFNFDYLRKNHPHAKPLPWEMIGSRWFPHVRIPLLDDVTTVVGANESGKSHLLSAIQKGLSGAAISLRDFCRYSQFFTVEQGQMRSPDFGFHFGELSEGERGAVRAACEITATHPVDEFYIFRSKKSELTLWLPKANTYEEFKLKDDSGKSLLGHLPNVFEIEAKIGLPQSVPFSFLSGESTLPWSRPERHNLFSAFAKHIGSFASKDTISSAAPSLAEAFKTFIAPAPSSPVSPTDRKSAEYALARDLLCKVAKIDIEAIKDLRIALGAGDEGLVNGILQEMNYRLHSALNFPKWWVQDKDFRLLVSARDDDLVFTIRDRTQTEYSFRERSSGLKYFVSYYVQYLAHRPPADRSEILLMDEPDAYLSSQGQQDLLKIFNSFAHPEDGRRPVQVVYVTHSPFLIDKNHGERIRVLEKGGNDEGTRVVKDVSKNHYEPLRSSFGSFVGETTFIGSCNLVVEGLADQILIATATTFLRQRGAPRTQLLDLNHVTIVPAGCASQIPYLVFLARGRDIERPAVVVLLDSDQGGDEARKLLRRKGPWGKTLLDDEFIVRIKSIPIAIGGNGEPVNRQIQEIEDLVPPDLACEAARLYLKEFVNAPEEQFARISASEIESLWDDEKTLFDAVEAHVKTVGGEEMHVDKVGFARSIVSLLADFSLNQRPVLSEATVDAFCINFGALLKVLATKQRAAERAGSGERISQRVDRAIKGFLSDHPSGCRKEEAELLFEEVDTVLDDTIEGDQVRMGLQELRREFSLGEDSASSLSGFERFADRLRQVRYAPRRATQDASDDGAVFFTKVRGQPGTTHEAIAGDSPTATNLESPVASENVAPLIESQG